MNHRLRSIYANKKGDYLWHPILSVSNVPSASVFKRKLLGEFVA